ncbi:MAG: TldD/PmbA family protein [Desulfomonilia bacterium]|nr:TldD/PmbA family protein [Desulfomonilia bacterium]
MSYLNRSKESGISVRVLLDGAMGFSYSPEATEDLVEAAICSASYQFKDEHNHIPVPAGTYPDHCPYDPAIQAMVPEDCIEQAITLETSARNADERVEKIRKSSFSRHVSHVQVVNSQGIDRSVVLSTVSASLMVMVRQADDMQSGYDFDFKHVKAEMDIASIASGAVSRATELLGARQIQTARIPVLFDATSTAQILGFISDAFLGENLIKGKSYLKDKHGTRCFSPMVRLVENPLSPEAADVCPFDGEGVPSQITTLVDEGIVTGFLYDSYWGHVAGHPSTGNSVRNGYRSWPVLGIRHLCMEGSQNGLQETVCNFKKVLKVTDIMGMHTANPVTGELSVGVNGIFMDQGVPLFPVREAAISGNIYDMFSRILCTGNDLREFPQVKCPSVLIDAVDISSG